MTEQQRDEVLLKLLDKSQQHDELLLKLLDKVEHHDELFNKLFDKVEHHDELFNKLFDKVEHHDELFNKLFDRIDHLEASLKETNNYCEKISHSVAVIEIEHGNKISALFDAVAANSEKCDNIQKDIKNIYSVLSKHDDEIFLLKQKV